MGENYNLLKGAYTGVGYALALFLAGICISVIAASTTTFTAAQSTDFTRVFVVAGLVLGFAKGVLEA